MMMMMMMIKYTLVHQCDNNRFLQNPDKEKGYSKRLPIARRWECDDLPIEEKEEWKECTLVLQKMTKLFLITKKWSFRIYILDWLAWISINSLPDSAEGRNVNLHILQARNEYQYQTLIASLPPPHLHSKLLDSMEFGEEEEQVDEVWHPNKDFLEFRKEQT